jgi:uncharacterized protein YqiB (DUF1249 family)
LKPHDRYRIDLSSHMAECDANYVRLMKLAPDLRGCDDERALSLSLAEQDVTVRIRLVERCPYTSVLELTQGAAVMGLSFDLPQPRILIRLYHDARSAEVVEYQNGRRFSAVYPYPNAQMRQRDEKVQINRFLGEYLSVCLSHGAALKESAVASDG